MEVHEFRESLTKALQPRGLKPIVIAYAHPDQPWELELASIEIRVRDQQWICQAEDLSQEMIAQITAEVGIMMMVREARSKG
jgi:hypothetical protein